MSLSVLGLPREEGGVWHDALVGLSLSAAGGANRPIAADAALPFPSLPLDEGPPSGCFWSAVSVSSSVARRGDQSITDPSGLPLPLKEYAGGGRGWAALTPERSNPMAARCEPSLCRRLSASARVFAEVVGCDPNPPPNAAGCAARRLPDKRVARIEGQLLGQVVPDTCRPTPPPAPAPCDPRVVRRAPRRRSQVRTVVHSATPAPYRAPSVVAPCSTRIGGGNPLPSRPAPPKQRRARPRAAHPNVPARTRAWSLERHATPPPPPPLPGPAPSPHRRARGLPRHRGLCWHPVPGPTGPQPRHPPRLRRRRRRRRARPPASVSWACTV